MINAHRRLALLDDLTLEDLKKFLVTDECPVVRHEAAFKLGERFGGNPEAAHALCEASADRSILVRHEVALALAHFPCEQTAAVLVDMVLDPSPDVAASAQFAIVQMVYDFAEVPISRG
jgi:HEAT repeat protein